MSIDEAFNKSVEYYDSWVQNALPRYQEIFGIAVQSIPFRPSQKLNVLDLGAGTGLFSWHVLQVFKESTYTLVDLAEKMLELSKIRFADSERQFSYMVADYTDRLPDSTYDLIISSLSIHHLDAGQKKELFGRIFQRLDQGGVVINVDQVKGASPFFEELYWSTWLKDVRAGGASEEQIQESIKRRAAYDKDATLEEQLKWMRSAGFEEVDCLYRHNFIGLFYARK